MMNSMPPYDVGALENLMRIIEKYKNLFQTDQRWQQATNIGKLIMISNELFGGLTPDFSSFDQAISAEDKISEWANKVRNFKDSNIGNIQNDRYLDAIYYRAFADAVGQEAQAILNRLQTLALENANLSQGQTTRWIRVLSAADANDGHNFRLATAAKTLLPSSLYLDGTKYLIEDQAQIEHILARFQTFTNYLEMDNISLDQIIMEGGLNLREAFDTARLKTNRQSQAVVDDLTQFLFALNNLLQPVDAARYLANILPLYVIATLKQRTSDLYELPDTMSKTAHH